jgi:AcrR family transcriptional regulator
MSERSVGLPGAKNFFSFWSRFPGADMVANSSRTAAHKVPTQVKDLNLVSLRRRQIVDAAVGLFVEKGFHRTTTREIARAAGLSIGSLYEYVVSKEDLLFLVCDAIHGEMEAGVTQALARAHTAAGVLAEMIREYFLVCDRMTDHIVLIYQETQSLPRKWRTEVLKTEVRVTGRFIEALHRLCDEGVLPPLEKPAVDLMAHNIVVWGHMWALRRWFLARQYTIDQYISLQTALILNSFNGATVSAPGSQA